MNGITFVGGFGKPISHAAWRGNRVRANSRITTAVGDAGPHRHVSAARGSVRGNCCGFVSLVVRRRFRRHAWAAFGLPPIGRIVLVGSDPSNRAWVEFAADRFVKLNRQTDDLERLADGDARKLCDFAVGQVDRGWAIPGRVIVWRSTSNSLEIYAYDHISFAHARNCSRRPARCPRQCALIGLPIRHAPGSVEARGCPTRSGPCPGSRSRTARRRRPSSQRAVRSGVNDLLSCDRACDRVEHDEHD